MEISSSPAEDASRASTEDLEEAQPVGLLETPPKVEDKTPPTKPFCARYSLGIFIAVAAIFLLVIIVFVATLGSPAKISAPLLAPFQASTNFSSAANTPLVVNTLITPTCTAPCSVKLSFMVMAGSPEVSIFIGSDPVPFATIQLTPGTQFDISIGEGDIITPHRCTSQSIATSACVLRSVLKDPSSHIAGELAVAYIPATPTPTPSTSYTPTSSATPTGSPTGSATPTSSSSGTSTISPSSAETPSITSSIAQSPSAPPTPTATLSEGASPSQTYTPAVTSSVTVTNTRTGTASNTPTRSGSASHTSSRTHSATPSSSPAIKLVGRTTTFVGQETEGFSDGTGTDAQFHYPSGVAYDRAAGILYIADGYKNNAVRQVTLAGVVTTLAGQTPPGYLDATGTEAQFNGVTTVALSGGVLFVADSQNNMIRQVTLAGDVSTFAGQLTAGKINGRGTNAQFKNPVGIVIDTAGYMFVADASNNLIRAITPGGDVTTLAGSSSIGLVDGTGTSAKFFNPVGICFDRTQTDMYVSDTANNAVRKLTRGGAVSTFAGQASKGLVNGVKRAAKFNLPTGIIMDVYGNLYVSDIQNYVVRKITVPAGVVTTFLGNGLPGYRDGTGSNATLGGPVGMTFLEDGTLILMDAGSNTIRKVT